MWQRCVAARGRTAELLARSIGEGSETDASERVDEIVGDAMARPRAIRDC